jgi:hypothetical protein
VASKVDHVAEVDANRAVFLEQGLYPWRVTFVGVPVVTFSAGACTVLCWPPRVGSCWKVPRAGIPTGLGWTGC